MTRPRARLLAGLTALLSLAAHGASPEPKSGTFTLLFAGGSAGDGQTPALIALKARLAQLPADRAAVVFTGNYSQGELPDEGEAGRARAERDLLAHVGATADFARRGGKVYFLPGHRDFAAGGTQAVRRMRRFLNRAFEAAACPGLDVMPEAACGTPTRVELSSSLGLLLVNSQWWMQKPLADPELDQGCSVKTRKAFLGNLTDAFREHRTLRLVVASHHPLRSYGELGGAFPASAHLSPAPIVGTAWVMARQAGLVPQHQNHPMVHEYVELVRTEAERNGAFLFASGHDANLQALMIERQLQLISGTSAATARPVTSAAPGDFALAAPGWVELEVDAAAGGRVRLIALIDAQPRQVFERALSPMTPLAPPKEGPAPALPPGPVSATYSKDAVWKFPGVVKVFAGTYYSDAFSLRLPYEVLDLQTEQGGLTPYKVGGGLQTNSLRLKDPRGGDWAIRSTTKDSSRLLPHPINRLDFLTRLLEHGFTATHPEAPLAIPRLAEAIGVLHDHPKLMYLPDQSALGPYRGFITDEVVLLEQRPKEPDEGVLPEHLAGKPPAHGKTRFRNYEEMVEKLLEQPEEHRLDQDAMLRARLLDMLVGDWDRHRGQWSFAARPNPDGTKTYSPIPRDRDQMFANYDGAGLQLARLIVPQARSLQPFTGKYGRIGWLNFNARDVDALLLNRLDRERWRQLATQAQAAVTDAVIDEALSSWHPEAYALDGARIAAALKTRRDRLVLAAEEFYEFLARRVDVVGSIGADRFEVWFAQSGAVRVTVRPRDLTGAPWFERTFLPAETEALNLYALEGDDLLEVHGAPHSQLEVRFIGGEGNDAVTAPRGSAGRPVQARAIRLYDSVGGARIDPSVWIEDERSSVARLNQYEQRENHEFDTGAFMPGLYVNPDDGVYLGGKYTLIAQGYKRTPFAARHEVSAHFATATLGAALDYRGLFPQSAAQLDQQLEVSLRSPTYTRNFYGLTNRYVGDGDTPDFYRVRQAGYAARYGLWHGFEGDRARAGIQLLGQAVITEPTPGRFVTFSPDVTPDTIGAKYFGGARLFAETNTFDNLNLPRRGVALHASAEGRFDLGRGGPFSITYKAAAAAAIPIDRQQRVVLLSRASLEGIVGEHPFYFAPTLGDAQLRAFHQEQLAADVAFAHTTDLRIDVVRIASMLPGTIGVNVSLDHGRVFGEGIEGAGDYHLSYGAGVWWSIVDLIGISVSYHRSLDGASRFSLAAGPLFDDTGF